MIQKRTATAGTLLLGVLMLVWVSASIAQAQSIDANAPSPIHNNTLTGRIAARDVGDSRLTDHYYEFVGTPGDVIITVQSKNLNGDLDVFTAGTLRPLLKLTLYAESSSPVTKTIYLRRREDLILRIEARSPNDEEGTYQVSFSGSFEAIPGVDIAETETSPTSTAPATPGSGKTRRVTSAGARIDEPPAPVEVAAAPTPEPTPVATPTPVESPTPKPRVAKSPNTRTPSQNARTRRPATRTTPTTKPKPTATEPATPAETASATEPPVKKEEAEPTTAETTEPAPKPKPSRTPTRRSGTTAKAAKSPPPANPATPKEPEPETGPRLLIETNDGTLINRSMSGVRRVTVENGQVVVVGKDGKIDRILLSNVVRMTIQP